MKKLRILVLGLFVVFLGSASLAQNSQRGFGVYTGWPALLGVQLSLDNLRLSGGLAPSFAVSGASVIGLTASADYILARAPLQWLPGLNLEYFVGAGVTGLLYVGSAGKSSGSIFSFDGHGLLGLEYVFTDGQFGIFSESQLGIGSYAGVVGPAFGGRFGVIFR